MIADERAREPAIGVADPLEPAFREGRRRTVTLLSAAVVKRCIGTPVSVAQKRLHALVVDGDEIDGMVLHDGEARGRDLSAPLKTSAASAGVSSKRAAARSFAEMLPVIVGFTGLVACGVVQADARITRPERARACIAARAEFHPWRDMRPPPLGDLALVTAAPLPVGPARGRSLAAGMGEAFTNERLHTPSSSDHAPPESQRHGPRHDGARRASDASPSRLPEPRRRLEEADVNRSPRPASLAVLTADRLRLRLSLRTAGRRDRRDPRPPCRWWPARARGAPAPARSTSSQLRLPSECRASVRGPIDRAVLTVVQKRESGVGAGVPPVAIGDARGLEVVSTSSPASRCGSRRERG